MTQAPAVSPDGCRIAFDARPAGAIANGFPGAPTVKVLTLCDGSLPTASAAAGRKKAR
jgi:hypothetical protein